MPHICSKEYNEIAQKASERNSKEIETGCGDPLFDEDHWIKAQDSYNLSLVSVTEKETVGDETKIVVIINNFGQDTEINLSVKQENGKYVVSDFDGELQYLKDYLSSITEGMKLKDVCQLDGVKWVVSCNEFRDGCSYNITINYNGNQYCSNAYLCYESDEERTTGLTQEGIVRIKECPVGEEKTIMFTPDDFTDEAILEYYDI